MSSSRARPVPPLPSCCLRSSSVPSSTLRTQPAFAALPGVMTLQQLCMIFSLLLLSPPPMASWEPVPGPRTTSATSPAPPPAFHHPLPPSSPPSCTTLNGSTHIFTSCLLSQPGPTASGVLSAALLAAPLPSGASLPPHPLRANFLGPIILAVALAPILLLPPTLLLLIL